MMDCDTTGIEPDLALIKYKKLVGGGVIKIVNNTVPQALIKLGYTPGQAEQIVSHIDSTGTIEGAPHLKPEHLAVFDCSFRPQNGVRSIHYMGHVRMMAAVQPFISGAISKTINMPEESTVEDIVNAYTESWKLGLKAVAIYRDNSKKVQPLSSGSGSKGDKKASAATPSGATPRLRWRRWYTGPSAASCPTSAAPSPTSSRSAATRATSRWACTTTARRVKSSSPSPRKAPPFPA
jgi:ribonucleoside-diphosphate reductase alpha chain